MPDPAVIAVLATAVVAAAWPYLPWTRAARRRRQLRAFRDRLRAQGLLPPGWTVADIVVLPPPRRRRRQGGLDSMDVPPPEPSDGTGAPEDDDG